MSILVILNIIISFPKLTDKIELKWKYRKKTKKMVKNRIPQVLEFIKENGGDDGEHHKQWALDQIVRILTNCPKIDE